MYDLAELRAKAALISREHRDAINESVNTGADVARKDAVYRVCLAGEIGRCKAEHGATNAESLAKGSTAASKAKEELAVAEVQDRAAMERIRLARDDSQMLIALSRRQEMEE